MFSLFFLEKKHEDILLSFLYLVCLFAVKILASEALWGQFRHLYKLLVDHCECLHLLKTGGVWLQTKMSLFLLRNDAFSRVKVVSLKEINGGVPDGRN